MKKILAILLMIVLTAATINCGGGGSSSSKGMTRVAISLGSRSAGSLSAAAIPPDVTNIVFTIYASDMETITRTVSTVGRDAITEYFDIPSGNDRHVLVEAIKGGEPGPQPTPVPGSGNASGIISNALNGAGVPGFTVSLRSGQNATTGTIVASTVTGSDGSYAFSNLPAGTYTGEVSGTGFIPAFFTVTSVANTTTPNQNTAVTPTLGAGETRVVLTWGSTPSDLDSHMTGPVEGSTGRFQVYFGSQGSSSASPFTLLDTDDTDSFGPETITIYKQISGSYKYYIHDFTNGGSTTSTALGSSGAQVKVYQGSSLVQTFNVPPGGGTVWTVFEMNGTTITPINTMGSDPATIQSLKTGKGKTSVRKASALEEVLYRGEAVVNLDGSPKNIIIDVFPPTPIDLAGSWCLTAGQTGETPGKWNIFLANTSPNVYSWNGLTPEGEPLSMVFTVSGTSLNIQAQEQDNQCGPTSDILTGTTDGNTFSASGTAQETNPPASCTGPHTYGVTASGVRGLCSGSPIPIAANYVGNWKGNIFAFDGTTNATTLTLDSNLQGSAVLSYPNGSSVHTISGNVLSGILSFIFPPPPEGVGHPDCINWNVTCSSSLSQNLLNLNLNCSGTFCGSGGGQPGWFSGTLVKQ